MEKPDQLRELFRMQKSLNERIVAINEASTEFIDSVLSKLPQLHSLQKEVK